LERIVSDEENVPDLILPDMVMHAGWGVKYLSSFEDKFTGITEIAVEKP